MSETQSMTFLPTVGNEDMTQAVRESAMLVDITVSEWSGLITDKAASEKVKADAGAIGDAGKFRKNLLAGADAGLRKVRAAYRAVRDIQRKYTLPWQDPRHPKDGPTLLPLAFYDEFIKALAKQKLEAETARDEFLLDYAATIAKAKANLGGLASDADYPAPEEIKAKFKLSLDFTPIPSGAEFRGLPANTLDRLSKRLEGRHQAKLAEAQTEMWGRVKERVKVLVDRLDDPEAGFHASTVEKLRDLIRMLPGFNAVGNDPRVDEIVGDINRMLDGVDAEAMRRNDALRADVAAQGKAVAKKLNDWNL